VTLNGETRIRLDRNNPRFASLDYGEASFKVVHDPKSPFTLQLGDNRLVDVGTAFNVIVRPESHTVEVAEGAVVYNPNGDRIALAAGQTLTSKTRERRITLSQKPPADIGGWQRGRLSYRSSPLSDVAADISRSLGTTVSVQPAIASRSFTGTIEIDRDENRMFPRLAQLLDVDARRSGNGWTLVSAREPTH
jgi:transmembrane sensor